VWPIPPLIYDSKRLVWMCDFEKKILFFFKKPWLEKLGELYFSYMKELFLIKSRNKRRNRKKGEFGRKHFVPMMWGFILDSMCFWYITSLYVYANPSTNRKKKHKIGKTCLFVWLGSLLDLLINIKSSNMLVSWLWIRAQPTWIKKRKEK
jgi:hypothetical protein